MRKVEVDRLAMRSALVKQEYEGQEYEGGASGIAFLLLSDSRDRLIEVRGLTGGI
jgi:hypothetical protein